MAAKRAAKPLNEPAKAAVDDGGIYLDPKLAEIRDAEAKRNSVEIVPRADAEIDPALLPKKSSK